MNLLNIAKLTAAQRLIDHQTDSDFKDKDSIKDIQDLAISNVSHFLVYHATVRPDAIAIVMPEQHYNDIGKRMYSHLTFLQLNRLCDAYAHGLYAEGLRPGTRVLLMVSQGLELIALTFALFKLGAIPILIDPGMGAKSFLGCVRQVKPEAMIGIPKAYLPRHLFRRTFKTLKHEFVTKRKWFLPTTSLSKIANFDAGPYIPYQYPQTKDESLAAILFTSGSTGPPKGVKYTQEIFSTQSQAIQEIYHIRPGEYCVPAFPLFALFSTAMGSCCVIPDFDPSAPAKIIPEHMIEAIADFGATMAFGSPAVWKRVVSCCEKNDILLPSIERLLLFGAPIDFNLMTKLLKCFPNAVVHTPYGATEALPVASIDSRSVVEETATLTLQGKGICVGKPASCVRVSVIEISDDPIAEWGDVVVVDPYTVGEICVTGTTVTPGYWEEEGHDALSKIADPSVTSGFWHRMGDVGYIDDQGRLWYCGRKSHRVVLPTGTHFTIPCEAIINAHPSVYRSALVRAPDGLSAVIVVELEPGVVKSESLIDDLLTLAQSHDITKCIQKVVIHDALPVDRRHNAKIHRLELTQMLQG